MTDVDRNAILARRALFISATLAGIACTKHEDPAREREVTSSAQEPTPPSTEAEPDRRRPPWTEVLAKAPPLDVPEDLSEPERELLRSLARGIEAKYESLRAVWEITPDCPPTRTDCIAWSKAVQAMLDAWPDDGPLCGHRVEWTDTLEQRGRAHDRYLEQLRELLLADLDAAAKRWSEADAVAWKGLREPLAFGPPRPCLSCARPEAFPVLVSVPFAVDVAAIGTDAAALEALRRARELIGENGADVRLIVRGHADAGERDAERLAKERAEAVVAWLVAEGVAKGSLEARGYAGVLPISGESADNRRVDFQLDVPADG